MDYDEKWDSELRENGKHWQRIFAWAIIVLYPAWTIFDYFLLETQWKTFGLIRVVGALFILSYLLWGRFKNLNAIVLGYLEVLVMYVSIAYMLPLTGESLWFYSLGYSTAFIAAGILLYWKIIHSIITTGIACAAYVLFFMLNGSQSVVEIFGGGAFLTFTISISAILLNWMRMRLAKKEFILRMELLKTQGELKESLDEVSALKFKQDGDYFLTSLLIEPLAIQAKPDPYVRIDSLLRQKKKFQFKHWDAELGGDINISHNIELDGKPYVLFLNADAMGKSMQGASGALVLGAVFQSILTRTKTANMVNSEYPEQWLKDAFIELHHVFKSFDGSMLVSMIIGLVEAHTGLLYYINAEHPRAALYQNGKASYMSEARGSVRNKLGVPFMADELIVSLQKLNSGDVVIVGSDGRDDIKIYDAFLQTEEMNDDENLFLQAIEQGKGNLKRIYKKIDASGSISDDLSLMKITYNPDGRTLPFQSRNITSNSRQLKQRIQEYIELKKYPEALLLLHEFGLKFPQYSSYLYSTAFIYKKQGDLEKSADFGERMRLRKPKDLPNLLNLTEVYLGLNNLTQAEALLEGFAQFSPEKLAPYKNKIEELKTFPGRQMYLGLSTLTPLIRRPLSGS